jgi:DNA-binding transcriptional MerR regulator
MAEDLTLEQLAHAARLTPRAVRYYIERGLLPSAEPKGRNTRYSRDLVPRLLAIAELRLQGMRLDPIKRKLASMSRDEMEKLAPTAAPQGSPPAPRVLPGGFLGPYRPALGHGSERWDHVGICPGVVLMVRGEADAEAWRVAREIVELFGGAERSP